MRKTVILMTSLVGLGCGSVYAATVAGKVIFTSGKVMVGNKIAKRGMRFYKGQTIRTTAGSRAQIRYTDNTLVALAPGTIYKIDQYNFKKNEKQDIRTASLIKGGLRSITGTISKENPNAVKLKTKAATIGIRGTIYTAIVQGCLAREQTVKSNCTIYADAAKGVLSVGDVKIGTNMSASAFKVSPGGIAQTIPEIPASIKSILSNGGGVSPLSSAGSESPASGDDVAAGYSTESDNGLTQFVSSENQITDISSLAGLVESSGITYNGIVVSSAPVATYTDVFSLAADLTATTIFDPVFDDDLVNLGIVRGNVLTSATLVAPDVYFGEWDSISCSGALCNSAVSGSAAFPALWVTGPLTNETYVNNLTGTLSYTNLEFIKAADSNGLSGARTSAASSTLADHAFNVQLDFTNATYNGTLSVRQTNATGFTGGVWNGTLAPSTFAGGTLSTTSVTGTIAGGTNAGNNFTGDFNANLHGATADRLSTAFDLQDAIQVGSSLSGVAVIARP